jgi:GntR family transcriptional regulator
MKSLINEIDHKSEIPLHKQIQVVLRKLIESGEFDGGKLFPNEVDLSNLFAVSRNTVRQAFNTLVTEGLLQRKRGKGTTVVRKKEIVTHLNEWHSFTADMKKQGITIKNYLIDFTQERGDRKLVKLFNIPLERKINKLTRVKGSEEIPFVLFESWFHPRIAISKSHDYTRPLNQILELEYSVIAKHSSEKLKAIMADERIASILNIEIGSPVFYRERIVYDAAMRIIEFNKCYYRHDKMVYNIDIIRSL